MNPGFQYPTRFLLVNHSSHYKYNLGDEMKVHFTAFCAVVSWLACWVCLGIQVARGRDQEACEEGNEQSSTFSLFEPSSIQKPYHLHWTSAHRVPGT